MMDARQLGGVQQAGQLPPRRISFNFADRCNMSCRFCYIPFDGVRVDAVKAAEVIDAVLQWAPTAITFGGGDPLMYQCTVDLLRRIRRNGVQPFVQLDSNFIRPRIDDVLRELATLVDMVGVPLDALDPEIAHVMRSDRHHPDKVVALLPRLIEKGFCIKINTVVASPNVKHLPDLADFVASAGVHVWSLYEFWSIGDTANTNADVYSLSYESFMDAMEAATIRAPDVNIEAGAVESRQSAYFFVTPSGRAYTVSDDDASRYTELGNILTDEALVVKRWHEHADIASNELRVRDRRAISALKTDHSARNMFMADRSSIPSHPQTFA